MMSLIDRILDGITMYKVVLYGLLTLAVLAGLFGFLGILPNPSYQYIFSVLLLLVSCWVSNLLLAKIYRVPTNIESSLITGLILFFILSPIQNSSEAVMLILAALISMASKYLLAFKRRHIFNPTAFALVVLSFLGSPLVIWWVGSLVMLPFVAIVGFLILRKLRRFQMFLAFLCTAIVTIVAFGVRAGFNPVDVLAQVFTSWPIIFFGTVMLTEPLTTPPTKKLRLYYALLVGVLFGSQFHVGPIFATPELALIVGNVFSYIVSSKEKLHLSLLEKKKVASDMYELIFSPKGAFAFAPGQYMEWTLQHQQTDIRGNRRYFTIASSPTEKELRLGVRFCQKGSSFKKALFSLKNNDTLYAGQLAGDFTLPSDVSKKLVFLAGGIGITPFRSMLKYLIDTNTKRDIVLLYSNKTKDEIVYEDIFHDAEKKLGIKTVYTLTDRNHIPANWKGKMGRVDASLIQEEVPDCKNRTYYVSGPQSMVTAYEDLLKSMGIPTNHIVTDYFPGFV